MKLKVLENGNKICYTIAISNLKMGSDYIHVHIFPVDNKFSSSSLEKINTIGWSEKTPVFFFALNGVGDTREIYKISNYIYDKKIKGSMCWKKRPYLPKDVKNCYFHKLIYNGTEYNINYFLKTYNTSIRDPVALMEKVFIITSPVQDKIREEDRHIEHHIYN